MALRLLFGKFGSPAAKVQRICKIPPKVLRSEKYHQKLQVSMETTILFVFDLTPLNETKNTPTCVSLNGSPPTHF
jgi:hypothetical protein